MPIHLLVPNNAAPLSIQNHLNNNTLTPLIRLSTDPNPADVRSWRRPAAMRGLCGLPPRQGRVRLNLASGPHTLLTHFIYEFYPSHLLEKGLKYN
jgi:hypothetical protein